MKTYAWYFPNWHPTPLNDKWHGTGWTEWQCVKYATPRFEGHYQPKIPLWGYEDESDPTVFEKKIDAALSHGLDGFIFDYYWFKEEGPYRKDCIEKGFFGAPSCDKCEFAVMWANHDPIYVHPAAYRNVARELASGDIDEEFFKQVTDYCIDNYFCRPNYIKVDGKLLFGLWNLQKVADYVGSVDTVAKMISDFRARAAAKGYEIHFTACKNYIPGYFTQNKEEFNTFLKKLGVDSVFSYGWDIPESKVFPIVEYDDYRKVGMAGIVRDTEMSEVPMNPTVSTGWDSSPRTVQSDIYERKAGSPFCDVTVNNTPEAVGKAFEDMKEYLESGKSTGKFLTISTWNEWTEGNYLEPDEKYGFGYLEELKRVFGK